MVHQFLRAGNTAVITGAGAGGIGFSVALHCAKLGLRLVLADNDEHALASATKELATSGFNPESLLTVKTDVSDYSAMEKLANDARAFGNGRIDFLMLNAGVQAPTKDFDANGRAQLSAWTKTLDVNLFGVLNGTQAFVDGMKAQGTPAGIVITGSKQYVGVVSSLIEVKIEFNVADFATSEESPHRQEIPLTTSPKPPSKPSPNPSPTPFATPPSPSISSFPVIRSPSSPPAAQSNKKPSPPPPGLATKSPKNYSSEWIMSFTLFVPIMM